VDKFIKQEIKTPAYVRYMDDMVLWSNNKQTIIEARKKVTNFLFVNLKLALKTCEINSSLHGLSFLGYRIFHNKILLNKRSKNRFIKKINLFKHNLISNKWSQEEYKCHIIPLLEFTNYAQSKNLRRKYLNWDYDRWLEPCNSRWFLEQECREL